jgi:hypothetical protein
MDFEQFLAKLNEDINPDKAYKLYLQTKLLIIEQVLMSVTNLKQEQWDSIQKRVFSEIIDKIKIR